MPTCRLGLLVAALLLGLLLGLPPVTGTGAGKSGVCPELQGDLNCTQECLSDAECTDNLKCCQAGCATFCHMPNATSLRSGRVEVSAWPCLAPAQLPSSLPGLCAPS
ncbi:WAP four-disulfide core domain protein 2 isoform X2 [Kogia breviceps]|uniref:WAP four-disulfide core domain protein 2 isoform X2 n=1 Tax=Kogia breviceps TaxID=27615 RepID=UPI0027953365|nr:WAP four-disulfide core domain protein 2 isoform X2 [Kogia breviceps]